jgi:hypothetical protein
MNARPAPIPLRPDPGALERDQRRSFHRAIAAMALSLDGNRGAESLLRRAWPNDTTAQMVLKAAVSPTTAGSFPTIVATNPLAALAPASAAAQLFEVSVRGYFGASINKELRIGGHLRARRKVRRP